MNRIFQFAFSKIKGVKVYALIGRSGTGKSYHSKIVAAKYHIDLIIDDGLLIKGDRIIAGHSAKRDPNFIAAVRTAVFDDDDHRNEVMNALLKERYKRILIIGTSEKMVNKIAKRLELPAPEKIIPIEDVASEEEIETAMRIRYTEGKHVIPVPSIEVTRSAPQIVYDSMKVFMGRKGPHKRNQTYEKTIVRPEFSRPDKEELSEAVLTQMVKHAIGEYDPVMKVKKVRGTRNADSTYSVGVTLQLPARHYMSTTISDLQEYISDCIERYGGVMVKTVNIEIEGFYLRRPISICDYSDNTITLIYKVVGRGTEAMSHMQAGRELDMLTGLGNGFDPDVECCRPLLVGGGVGVPPLYRLAKDLIARGRKVSVVLGFNTAAEIFYADTFREAGADVYVSTADGSTGVKGFVTDAIREAGIEFDYFYACGPMPMLRALSLAYPAVQGELSFEERMGCGFGACMGCSCKTLAGNKRICKDGPVMKRDEIIW